MNTHNKNNATKNQPQMQHQSQQSIDDQDQTQQVYALQVIDDQSQIDGDSANEGDLAEYLTQANIITKVDDDGTTSESEGQLLLYDVDVLDAIKDENIKRKYVTTKGGQLHEITIADHQDPIELLTFEDDELE